MVTNNQQNRERDEDQKQDRPEGRRREHGDQNDRENRDNRDRQQPRTGHEILHDAAEQTAQAVSDALTEAAQMGTQRLTHAAQEMVEDFDLGDVAARTKRYARSNPMRMVALGIATAVLVGLLIQASKS